MEPLNQEQNSNKSVEQNSQIPQFQHSEKTNKFGKHFIFLLTLLIISLVGAGLVFAINSVSEEIEKQEVEVSDSYVDWKIYRIHPGPNAVFQIKYPPTWEISELRFPCPDPGRSGSVGVISPSRLNVTSDFESKRLSYLIQFCVNLDGHVTNQSGFVEVPQSVLHTEKVPLNERDVQKMDEYKTSLEIINLSHWVGSNETSANTSYWKTYKNEEYGFEFKYPAKLGEIENADSQKEKLNCNSNAYSEVLLVSFTHFTLQLACPTAVELNPSQGYRGEKEKILVAGRDSFYFDYVSVVGYHNKEVYIPLDGNYLQISHSFKLQDGYVDLSDEDFKKILSTFKFVDKSSVSISDWKTYRNEAYGFEFLIPADWFPVNSREIQSPDYKAESCECEIGYNILTDGGKLSIDVITLSQKKTIEELSAFNKLGRGGPVYEHEKVVHLGGSDALLYDYEGGPLGGRGYHIDLSNNKYWIKIGIHYTSGVNGIAVLNQVLSTFKFTK